MVPGLCDRNEHRYDSRSTKQYGGAIIKSCTIISDTWLEHMVASVFKSKKDFINSKYILALEDKSEKEEEYIERVQI